MRRAPLIVERLRASSLSAALHDLGRRRARRIAKVAGWWEQDLAAAFRGRRAKLRQLESSFLAACRRHAPETVEELAAFAAGARIPFETLFRLNLTELRAWTEKCTTLVFATAGRRGKSARAGSGARRQDSSRGYLFAHNEDWDPRRNDVFLLKVTLPKVSFAVVAYDGYLPGLSCGLNSHGLIHAINYLPCPDKRIGLPRLFVTRPLVTASSLGTVASWARRVPRAYAQSLHLAQGTEYRNLELSAQRSAIRRPKLPAGHANHVLAPALARRMPPPSPSSAARQTTVDRLLDLTESTEPPLDAARRILSDRSGLPYAVWREADSPHDRAATVVTAAFSTDRLELRAWRRRPDRSHPVVTRLD